LEYLNEFVRNDEEWNGERRRKKARDMKDEEKNVRKEKDRYSGSPRGPLELLHHHRLF
jgi:hypothetical protein